MLSKLFSSVFRPTHKTAYRAFAAIYPPIKGSKVKTSLDQVVSDIKDGQTVIVGGFGPCGVPQSLINALANHGAKNLKVVSSTAGSKDYGIYPLVEKKALKGLTTSELEENEDVIKMFKSGDMELNVLPQGTLAEKIRSGGLGIPAFYTSTGVGTHVEDGGVPIKYAEDGKTVQLVSEAREKRQFGGRDYLMEKTLLGDYSFIKAWKADEKGNCMFRHVARNFNPDVASAGKICIVEAEEIVPLGEIDGDDWHMSGIFVHRVVQSEKHDTKVAPWKKDEEIMGTGEVGKMRENIVKRAAKEIQDGMYVTLAKGLPKLVHKYVNKEHDVDFITESGIIGEVPLTGPANLDIINSDMKPVSLKKGAAILKASDSFAAYRGRHTNLIMMEGKQVSQNGDLANWKEQIADVAGPGPAIDLAASGTPITVLMNHTTLDGKPNILPKCTFTLTGKDCITKLITELAVFEFPEEGITLTELAPGCSIDDVKQKTGCEFRVLPNYKRMDFE